MNALLKNGWRLASGLLAFHFLLATFVWFTVPARIPTHFNLQGRADAWDTRSLLTWFVLPLVSLGVQLLIRLLSSPANCKTWNIPEKERFLQLTREQQAPVFELTKGFAGLAALCVTFTFLVLHAGMYLAAKGVTAGLPWYFQMMLFAPTVCLLASLIPWAQAVKKSILSACHS